MLQLKGAYRDGTTRMVMSPLELMRRPAALIPRPRLHLIRFVRPAGSFGYALWILGYGFVLLA